MFSNTAVADAFLVQGRDGFVGGSHELLHDLWLADLGTAESIRSGRPSALHDFDAMDPAALSAFLRGLIPSVLAAGRELSVLVRLPDAAALLDIGGGSGASAVGLIENLPSACATVLELPAVVRAARPLLDDLGFADRISFLEGDILRGLEEGHQYDGALLRAVLQVFGPDDAKAALSNTFRCLKPGGLILISGGGIIQPDRLISAGKMVMCEWPLGVDLGESEDLAKRAAQRGVANFVGLQARLAPSIRYARDLVEQCYVGEVLATTLVGSGIAWSGVSDASHAYMFDARQNATLLSVPTMHALDALQFVVGDLAEVRAVSAIRRPTVLLADTNEKIDTTVPDHLAIAATLGSGAVASIFYRGGTSRGENFRWEINGTEGDLVLTSPVGNLQVLAPTLLGGRGDEAAVAPLPVPSEYDLSGGASEGPAANVARLYAAFAADLGKGAPGVTAPDFRHAVALHDTLDRISAAADRGDR